MAEHGAARYKGRFGALLLAALGICRIMIRHSPRSPKTVNPLEILPNSRIVDDADNSPNQKLIEIHPADCENILKNRNNRNRPLRRHTVARFVEDMRNERFRTSTHQALSFDTNGNLLDGQHRLSAIAQLKKTFVLRVWFNRDPEDFAVIDTGVARLASDNLHHFGVPRSKIVAPGIKNILLFKQHPNRTWTNMAMPSNVAIAEFYSDNQSVIDKISSIVQEAATRHRLLNRTGLLVTCFLALETGYTEMEVSGFCRDLSIGAGLAEDSPVLAYRSYLFNCSQRGASERNLQQHSIACMIKVWNYCQKGERLKLFKAPPLVPMPTIELPPQKNTAKLSQKLRFEVLQRDGFTCQACGAKAVDGAILEVDHILPRARGGSNDPLNLQTLCSHCNGGKSDQVVDDFIF